MVVEISGDEYETLGTDKKPWRLIILPQNLFL